ncbi:glycosyl transferase [Rhodobacteraceae bacterium 4F10]|nr:glycosyl transferase [Rhodobacteraceae bacterium 4F10]
MRAPVSVVIPTLNAAAALPACLAALYEGVQAGIIRELIVVDGGSDDDTRTIADEAGATLVSSAPSRGGQLRAGVAASKGDWVLVVHADTCLEEGWSDVAEAHFATSRKAGYFHLSFDQGGMAARFVAGWANLRSRLFGLPYGDQGLLIARDVYDAHGGFEDIPLMEDVAMARALKGQLAPLQAKAITSADKYQRQGWLRRGARNLSTLVRYLVGVSPQTLAESYQRP